MIYTFVFGKQVFLIHSLFEINWYEWHKPFLKNSLINNYPVTDFYIQCYNEEPDFSHLPLLFHEKTQFVYQGAEGEIRTHYLLGTDMSIFCEERHDGYHIGINALFKQEAYMYFVAMMLEKMLLRSNALILHSSFIKYKEKAVLFTGPSGIGKSTQAGLWVDYMQGEIINGDRSVLQKSEGTWCACGFPICGTSKVAKDEEYPIRAIVYLGQSDCNTIMRMEGIEALKKVLSEISINYWNKADSEKALMLVEDICKKIPVYYLQCTPNVSAVNCLAEELML